MPATLKIHTDSFVYVFVCARGQIPRFRQINLNVI